MNEIATQATYASALERLSNALSMETGSKTYLKLDKTGVWLFGEDECEVESGSEWAVNPSRITAGFIAWQDGVKLGEEMRLITDDPLRVDELHDVGAGNGPGAGG